MQLVPRAFLALDVLCWLISVPLFSRLASAAGPPPGHSGDDQGDEGGDGATRTGRCGSDPGDTDELASVRATAADQCDCAGAGDHGRYVNCVAHVADAAVRSGSLRKACRDSVMRCAAKSVCGKKDSVTCCRTDARGNAKCSIKHSATECKAPHGGTACVGQVPSCCDACGAGGSCVGSTTTTTAPVETTTTTAPVETTTTTAPAETTTTTAPAETTTTTAPVATTTTTSTITTSTTTTQPPTTTT